ncbi:MAG: toluene tolerance protein [Deltaproteobacteria bacterium]|nr:toluene tolerance protein [Deltaproteobacteria bacterium]
MKKLDQNSYERMVAGAAVISRDLHGDKVLKLPDGLMVKLFRLKRRLSSAIIWPYAKRFERGAKRLREIGIPSVEVIETFRVRFISRDVVVYHPLEGKTLRETIASNDNKKAPLKPFSAFLAGLHNRGIYFRAIHFGNVIVLPNGEFGLIDVSELRLSHSSLSVQKRVRNFKPMLSYNEDRTAILDFGLDLFLDSYIENSSLPPNARQSFLEKVRDLYGTGSAPNTGH